MFCVLHFSAFAAPYDLIIGGIGGDADYTHKFAEQGRDLRDLLVGPLGHPAQNVTLLLEAAATSESLHAPDSRIENIQKAVDQIAENATTSDTLFVYLIGHGSYDAGVSNFNIEGPDLSAAELKRMLGAVACRQIVVIDTTASSAGFINALGGAGLIVCTATKSVDEINATQFMQGFLNGLADGSADQNRDGRISVLEACRQAAALTGAWYEGEGLIQTEHALIEDDGDALGTRLAAAADDDPNDQTNHNADGALAATVFIKNFQYPPSVPRALAEDYRAALAAVEELKRQKVVLGEREYISRLEKTLLEAARINRRIHQAMGETTTSLKVGS